MRLDLIFPMRYIHQFPPGPNQKTWRQQRQKHQVERHPSMQHLSNDHEDHLNQEAFLFEYEGNKWKQRQEHDCIFSVEGKPLENKY